MIVLLVRHGQTEYTRTGRFLGLRDADLDEVGIRQAREARNSIARFAPDLAVSSPLGRARRTLELMSPPGVEFLVDERLREVDFGAWEGKEPDAIARLDPAGMRAFGDGALDRFPGGESLSDVAGRVADTVLGALGIAQRLLLVGHTTSLRLGLTHLLGLEPRRYRRLFGTLRPCHWAKLDVDSGGATQLLEYNVGRRVHAARP